MQLAHASSPWLAALVQGTEDAQSPTRLERLQSLDTLLARDPGDGVKPSEFGLV